MADKVTYSGRKIEGGAAAKFGRIYKDIYQAE